MTHQLRVKDYRQRFPNAPLMCQDMRNNLSKIAKNRPPQTEETKNQISKTMKKRYAEIPNFPLKNQNQNQKGELNNFFGKNHCQETKEYLSKTSTKWLKKAYAEGRKISPFSYLGNGKRRSQFEIEVYRLLKPIGFTPEFVIPFSKGAFKIDFALEEKMIAVELDSELHDKPQAKAVDARKDKLLKKRGWNVIRIKFNASNDHPIDIAEDTLIIIKGAIKDENKINKKIRKLRR